MYEVANFRFAKIHLLFFHSKLVQDVQRKLAHHVDCAAVTYLAQHRMSALLPGATPAG